MDTQLKKAAMKKARNQGLNLSVVLNMATRAYVDNKLTMTAIEHSIERGLDDIRHGRVISLEDFARKLRAKSRR